MANETLRATAGREGVADAIARVHREEWARIVAGLARRYGDLSIAEETAADAFATAVERWPQDGVPPNPGAWLTTTAHRRAIDRLRRETRRDEKQREALRLRDDSPAEEVGAVEDDRLRLLFTCCHPVLSLDARAALTLRIVGGLTVAEIAHAFLVQETTMGQRITRAKARIKAAGVPYRMPRAADLPERTGGVLTVLYLIFNEGYLTSGPGSAPLRHDLTGEAIRLTRLLRELRPEDGEVTGLLALMLLTQARAPARLSPDGELVRLDEQDRRAWDRALIDEGLALVGEGADIARRGTGRAGRHQLLARINAVHVSARHPRDTDWARIVALYEQLERLDPSPVVTLNRAIAVAELRSPRAGLAIVDALGERLAGHHAFHATRAELLRLLGRASEARSAYDRAIALAQNSAEVVHLTGRRDLSATTAPTPTEGEHS
ncbi:RNA polymerase sigma factor [Microbacterium marinilacus]|uniref:RNA polymerase sigma factor n=1 Tax=Microbacterium marinilacus TaxID=415209 RepID=A0ABP7BTM5_9MICO|nr:RNA polymerase sigma factor [Microbacterium marinilacus]MBY0688268.1 RNA polymerase sigma factor [Microbacterium marinilacus]